MKPGRGGICLVERGVVCRYIAHGHRDQRQLVEWCHTHCGEWTPLARGCAPIAVERIAQALGKPPEIVRKLAREAAELNQLDEIFAGT